MRIGRKMLKILRVLEKQEYDIKQTAIILQAEKLEFNGWRCERLASAVAGKAISYRGTDRTAFSLLQYITNVPEEEWSPYVKKTIDENRKVAEYRKKAYCLYASYSQALQRLLNYGLIMSRWKLGDKHIRWWHAWYRITDKGREELTKRKGRKLPPVNNLSFF